MTNLELMLLEHAARFEYSDYSIKRKSQELFIITLEGDFANVATCVRLYMNKNCAKTFATFDERKGDDVVLKVKITCGTVTDVVQMIDKLAAPLREWYADLDELRNLSKVYPKPPQQFKTPNSPTTDLPPMPMPYREADHSIGIRNNLVQVIEPTHGELAPMSITVDDTATDAFSFGCYGHNRKPPLPAAPAQTTTAKGDDE